MVEAQTANDAILGKMITDAKLQKKSEFPNLEEEKKRAQDGVRNEFEEMCSSAVDDVSKDVIERGRVRLTDDIPPTDFLLYQNGVGTIPRRSLATIKGKPGQGKSLACSVFIASFLGCTDFGFDSPHEKLKIIYFDTEKNRVNTKELGERVNRMMGWNEHEDNEQLILYNYKAADVDERLEHIKEVVTSLHPDVIVIDGIVDCVNNYNDIDESKNVVEDLNRFSVEADVTIIVVLHTNKNDSNSQGHLGHFLLKKSHNEFELTQEAGTFQINHSKTNDGVIKDIFFSLDDTLTPVGAEGAQTKQLRTLFQEVFFDPSLSLTTEETVKRIMQLDGIKESMANKRIKSAVNTGILKRTERGVYALISN